MADIIPEGYNYYGSTFQYYGGTGFYVTYDQDLNTYAIKTNIGTAFIDWIWFAPKHLSMIKVLTNGLNLTGNYISRVDGLDVNGSAYTLWTGTWQPSGMAWESLPLSTHMDYCYGMRIYFVNANQFNIYDVKGWEGQLSLNDVIHPVGGGTVTANPPGWLYDRGTVVTLTETPAQGYTFSGWGGDASCPGTPTTCQITMDSDKIVDAYFSAMGDPTCTITWSPTNPVEPDPLSVTFTWTNANNGAGSVMTFLYRPDTTACTPNYVCPGNCESGTHTNTCTSTVAGQYHAQAYIVGADSTPHWFDFYIDVAPSTPGGAVAVFQCLSTYPCDWHTGPFTPGQQQEVSSQIYVYNTGNTGTIHLRFYYKDPSTGTWNMLPNCIAQGQTNCDVTGWVHGLGLIVNIWVDIPANIPLNTILFGAKVWGDGETEPSFP